MTELTRARIEAIKNGAPRMTEGEIIALCTLALEALDQADALAEAEKRGYAAAKEQAAKVAQGQYPSQSTYDDRSPLYGMDLSPDRTDFGRGKQAGRQEAAAAIRAMVRP